MLEIKRVSSNEISSLIDFIKKHRTEWTYLNQLSLLSWQYGPNQYLNKVEKYNIFIAIEKNEILGMICYIPFNFCFKGEIFSGVWPANWYTKMNIRKDVGLRLLMRLTKMNFDLTFVGKVTNIAEKIYERLNYHSLGAMPRYFGIIDKESFIKISKISNPSLTKEKQENHIRKQLLINNFSTEMEIKEVNKLGNAWDEFWNTNIQNSFVGVNKCAKYLNWRYFNHPIFNYRALISSTGSIKGILIYRIEKVKNLDAKFIRILDLIGVSSSFEGLVCRLISLSKKLNIAFVDFFSTSKK